MTPRTRTAHRRKVKRGPKTQAEVDAMNEANPIDVDEMKGDERR